MTWIRVVLPLAVAALFTLGCEGILGIEDRALDIEELTVSGYEGCEPADAVCSGCTSIWHQCICDGWKRESEAELRAGCASKAPESIRAEQEKKWPIEEGSSPADAGKKADAGLVPEPEPQPPLPKDFCATEPEDACGACLCTDCEGAAEDCTESAGCGEIMGCVVNSGCDVFAEGGPKSCDLTCADEIEDNKGSAETYLDLVQCLVEEDCPCGSDLTPEPCSQADDCEECSGCFEECRCEGRTEVQCETECAPACSPINACAGCLTCVADCQCRGDGTLATCQALCEPPDECSPVNGCFCGSCVEDCVCAGETRERCEALCKADACSPEQGCSCNTCYDLCLCDGKTELECETECPAEAPCSAGDGCGTCNTCMGHCNCENEKTFAECMNFCGLDSCAPGSCDTCNGCSVNCDCKGNDAFMCRDQCLTNDCVARYGDDACASCSCEACPLELVACEELSGCPELMQCMRDENCYSIEECNRPGRCRFEIDQLGGFGDPRVGVAEALHGCRYDQACPCDSFQPPPSVQCGTLECYGYQPLPPDAILYPCCTGSSGDQCGLDMDPLFGAGTGCAPIFEPGTFCSDCPGFSPDRAPWFEGEVLPGCCREDGLCGFEEFNLGLGCAAPSAFGQAGTQTCPGTCGL